MAMCMLPGLEWVYLGSDKSRHWKSGPNSDLWLQTSTITSTMAFIAKLLTSISTTFLPYASAAIKRAKGSQHFRNHSLSLEVLFFRYTTRNNCHSIKANTTLIAPILNSWITLRPVSQSYAPKNSAYSS